MFDVNADCLVAPKSMKAAIESLLGESVSTGELFASIFHSLAAAYADVVKEIEDNLGIVVPEICIVGGGAKNGYLNELTEKRCGKPVVALPIEATAIGNIKTQIR